MLLLIAIVLGAIAIGIGLDNYSLNKDRPIVELILPNDFVLPISYSANNEARHLFYYSNADSIKVEVYNIKKGKKYNIRFIGGYLSKNK